MISQVQLDAVRDTLAATQAIDAQPPDHPHTDAAYPSLIARRRLQGIEGRVLEKATATSRGMAVIDIHTDVRDAMGANLVNTIAEAVADRLAELAEANVGLRILSNLADRRCVRVKARVNVAELATENYDGEEVRDGIVASRFASSIHTAPYRSSIMNGVDAAVSPPATAGMASKRRARLRRRQGRGRRLRPAGGSRRRKTRLVGHVELHGGGRVGGTPRVHPGGAGARSSASARRRVGAIMACAGWPELCSACARWPRRHSAGHMSLHARSLAFASAPGELVAAWRRAPRACGDRAASGKLKGNGGTGNPRGEVPVITRVVGPRPMPCRCHR